MYGENLPKKKLKSIIGKWKDRSYMIENLIFEDRSIDHDRKSIFDRNHYFQMRQGGNVYGEYINDGSLSKSTCVLISV